MDARFFDELRRLMLYPTECSGGTDTTGHHHCRWKDSLFHYQRQVQRRCGPLRVAPGRFARWLVWRLSNRAKSVMVQYRAQRTDTGATKAIRHAVEVYAECAAPCTEGRTRCSGGNGASNLDSGNTDRRCGSAWLPCQQRHPASRRTADRHGDSAVALRQVVPHFVRAVAGDPHAQRSGRTAKPAIHYR